MSKRLRYDYTWHVGETATPFTLQLVDAEGVARADIASATFAMVRASDGFTIIASTACDSVAGGLLSYTPGSDELAACRFYAQFTATTTDDGVLPSDYVEGAIEANAGAVAGTAYAPNRDAATATLSGATYGGEPTYYQRFAGSSLASGASELIASGVTSIVSCGGWVSEDSEAAVKRAFPCSLTSGTYQADLTVISGALYVYAGSGFALNPYDIWVEFTL